MMSSAPTQEIPRIRDTGDPMSAPTQEVPIVATGGPGTAWQRGGYQPSRIDKWFNRLRDSPAWIAPAAMLACFAAAATWVLSTDPTDDLGPTTCAFKMVTGFDCPGCGGTRAFYYVLTANFPEAARNHAIALFAAPFLVYFYVVWSLRRVFPKVRWRFPKFRLTPIAGTYFMVAWAGYWVLRNLPFAPFTSLYV